MKKKEVSEFEMPVLKTWEETWTWLQDTSMSSHVTLFHRLQAADKLLRTPEWINDVTKGGGDTGRAYDRLESLCFAPECGKHGFMAMIELVRQFPDIKVWKANHYNANKMYTDWKATARAEHHKDKKKRPASRVRRECVKPEELRKLEPEQQIKHYTTCYTTLERTARELDNSKIEAKDAEKQAKGRLEEIKTKNEYLKEAERTIRDLTEVVRKKDDEIERLNQVVARQADEIAYLRGEKVTAGSVQDHPKVNGTKTAKTATATTKAATR